MDYVGILKRAYDITIKNRYLWLLAILAGGVGGSWGTSFSNSTHTSEKWENVFNQSSLGNFWGNYATVIFLVLGVIILLGILWMIIATISQGGILGSVRAIEKGEKHNFWTGFSFGWHKFWRVFGLNILIFAIILLSIVILVLPVVLLVLAKIYVLAIIYGILLFLFDLILWIFIGLMFPYIQRLAVLGDKKSWQAVILSWDFFKKHFVNLVLIYFLLMAAGFMVTLAAILAFIVVGGLLVAIGYGLYLVSMAVFWMYVAVFGVALIVFILILGGAVNAFNSAVYTLAYLELTKS